MDTNSPSSRQGGFIRRSFFNFYQKQQPRRFMQTQLKMKLKQISSFAAKTPRLWRGLAAVAALLAAVLAPIPVYSAGTNPVPKLAAGMRDGQLQLQLRGASNQIYRIEASTNLVNWTVLAQRAGGPGTVTVTDSRTGQFAQRYYQAVPMAQPNGPTGLGEGGFAPDKILVKPKAGVSLGGLNLSLGIQVLNVFPAIGNLQVVKVPSGMTASTLIAAYAQSVLVQYAEPDFYVHALATPDDQYYPWLWGFHNTNQFGGVAGADIDAPDAWDIQHDAGNIIVAVVDTGVRYTHEDLAAEMWVNPADGSHGTNAVAGNTDPNDDYGHGTHVAGTIGAAGNNGIGVVGVAWRVQIMACKFLDSTGNGTIDGAIACLDYARSHGANIVNASWGATSFTSQSLHDAIASLRDAGIMFVAAAGNSGANNDMTPLYPASYSDLNNIISVAATDPSDALASFSDYGLTNVDLGAPGATIGSCWNGSDSDYEYDDGTSMACAMMSGAVAVMEAHFPSENYQQIKQQILANVDPLPGLQGKCVTGGRLNLYKALTGGTPPPPTLAAHFSANPTSGQAPLTVQFTDESTGSIAGWDWNFGDGSTHSTTQDPSHTYNAAGNFTATLTVTGAGGATSSKSQTVTVTNGTSSSQPVITLTATQPDAYFSGEVPGTVNFHRTGDTSQAYEVNWTFGGTAVNGVDFQQLPTNSPFPAGQSDATLTITPINHGQTGDKTVIVTLASGAAYQIGSPNNATITIHAANTAPVAGFTANPGSGQTPLTVQFTDTSTGSPTNWNWNFGDGSADSSAQNPSHTYSTAGTFTASLTVTGNGGQTSSASHTITVTNTSVQPVTASFSANPTSGQAPLTVTFTDQSTGPVTAWNWNFGDGATSTSQNPSHTYNNAGSFTASLTVTGSGGQTSSASHTITATNAPLPVTAGFAASPSSGAAPLSVQFTDQSTGPVTAWNWNFGDGATSTSQNPSHTYSSTGSFTATLTVTGSSGQTSSASRSITVTNTPPPPTATVTVVATQPLATSLTPGVFSVTRTGSTGSGLTVNYTLGGTAQNGVNYQTLSGTVVIPAGSNSATVEVDPTGLLDLLRTVVLTVSPEPAYTVGSPNSATVTIVASLGL
jgi:PKD repeat protein